MDTRTIRAWAGDGSQGLCRPPETDVPARSRGGREMSETTATVPRWHAAGDWFDTCKCNVPCPCSFAQLPTHGDCDGILAWHIREGRYGDVRLDGLNVLMVASFVGNIWAEHTDTYAAVFVDERADDPQR